LKKYNKPIYITENGLADADDSQREKFIKDHLKYIHKAIEEEVDVRGYFYWSLLDNFEWDKGFWPRFGLIKIDYNTLERKIRPSAWKYAEICKNNEIEIKH
jgi:beta-glucosidase